MAEWKTLKLLAENGLRRRLWHTSQVNIRCITQTSNNSENINNYPRKSAD
jgi:hypothetical protein